MYFNDIYKGNKVVFVLQRWCSTHRCWVQLFKEGFYKHCPWRGLNLFPSGTHSFCVVCLWKLCFSSWRLSNTVVLVLVKAFQHWCSLYSPGRRVDFHHYRVYFIFLGMFMIFSLHRPDVLHKMVQTRTTTPKLSKPKAIRLSPPPPPQPPPRPR